MIAYAEPNCFIGIILGTEGHIAEGTSEKAIPKRTITITANHQTLSKGIANNTVPTRKKSAVKTADFRVVEKTKRNSRGGINEYRQII